MHSAHRPSRSDGKPSTPGAVPTEVASSSAPGCPPAPLGRRGDTGDPVRVVAVDPLITTTAAPPRQGRRPARWPRPRDTLDQQHALPRQHASPAAGLPDEPPAGRGDDGRVLHRPHGAIGAEHVHPQDQVGLALVETSRSPCSSNGHGRFRSPGATGRPPARGLSVSGSSDGTDVRLSGRIRACPGLGRRRTIEVLSRGGAPVGGRRAAPERERAP